MFKLFRAKKALSKGKRDKAPLFDDGTYSFIHDTVQWERRRFVVTTTSIVLHPRDTDPYEVPPLAVDSIEVAVGDCNPDETPEGSVRAYTLSDGQSDIFITCPDELQENRFLAAMRELRVSINYLTSMPEAAEESERDLAEPLPHGPSFVADESGTDIDLTSTASPAKRVSVDGAPLVDASPPAGAAVPGAADAPGSIGAVSGFAVAQPSGDTGTATDRATSSAISVASATSVASGSATSAASGSTSVSASASGSASASASVSASASASLSSGSSSSGAGTSSSGATTQTSTRLSTVAEEENETERGVSGGGGAGAGPDGSTAAAAATEQPRVVRDLASGPHGSAVAPSRVLRSGSQPTRSSAGAATGRHRHSLSAEALGADLDAVIAGGGQAGGGANASFAAGASADEDEEEAAAQAQAAAQAVAQGSAGPKRRAEAGGKGTAGSATADAVGCEPPHRGASERGAGPAPRTSVVEAAAQGGGGAADADIEEEVSLRRAAVDSRSDAPGSTRAEAEAKTGTEEAQSRAGATTQAEGELSAPGAARRPHADVADDGASAVSAAVPPSASGQPSRPQLQSQSPQPPQPPSPQQRPQSPQPPSPQQRPQSPRRPPSRCADAPPSSPGSPEQRTTATEGNGSAHGLAPKSMPKLVPEPAEGLREAGRELEQGGNADGGYLAGTSASAAGPEGAILDHPPADQEPTPPTQGNAAAEPNATAPATALDARDGNGHAGRGVPGAQSAAPTKLASPAEDGPTAVLWVHGPGANAKALPLYIPASVLGAATVGELRRRAAETAGVAAGAMALAIGDALLDDAWTGDDLGLADGARLSLVRAKRAPAPGAPRGGPAARKAGAEAAAEAGADAAGDADAFGSAKTDPVPMAVPEAKFVQEAKSGPHEVASPTGARVPCKRMRLRIASLGAVVGVKLRLGQDPDRAAERVAAKTQMAPEEAEEVRAVLRRAAASLRARARARAQENDERTSSAAAVVSDGGHDRIPGTPSAETRAGKAFAREAVAAEAAAERARAGELARQVDALSAEAVELRDALRAARRDLRTTKLERDAARAGGATTSTSPAAPLADAYRRERALQGELSQERAARASAETRAAEAERRAAEAERRAAEAERRAAVAEHRAVETARAAARQTRALAAADAAVEEAARRAAEAERSAEAARGEVARLRAALAEAEARATRKPRRAPSSPQHRPASSPDDRPRWQR